MRISISPFHKGAWMWGYADDHSLLKQSYCTGETGRIAYGTGQAVSLAQAGPCSHWQPVPPRQLRHITEPRFMMTLSIPLHWTKPCCKILWTKQRRLPCRTPRSESSMNARNDGSVSIAKGSWQRQPHGQTG
jgi:hypothetical protein